MVKEAVELKVGVGEGLAVSPPEFTDRQLEYLGLAATGRTYRGIAKELDVSKHTVKNMFNASRAQYGDMNSGVFERLGVNNITSAVVKAIKLNLITLSEIKVQAVQNEEKPVNSLTPRQKEILVLVARGEEYKQISKNLVIAIGTIKAHFSTRVKNGTSDGIFARLGVYSRTGAIVRALQLGIIKLEEI